MRLYKKSYGAESKLVYLGRALGENRNGLISAATATHADGYAERGRGLDRARSKAKDPFTPRHRCAELRALPKVDWLFVFSCAAQQPA